MLRSSSANLVQMTDMKLETVSPPASALDTLDTAGVLDMLHIADDRTLARYIAEGLPVHAITRKHRLFIRGEVLDWVKSRCISPAAGSDAA